MIEPRTLRGFRDFLPEAMIPRDRLIDTARRVYGSYGFAPIDTPVLEYLEILQGKGGEETDRLLYSFRERGGRDVGMRFDLTVPLARFVAQHVDQLGLPFKRFHIAKVWRGENTQRGRYREFMQCDFDTIGTESVASDVEMILVVHDLMHELGMDEFTIRLNHRQILTGWLEQAGLAEETKRVLPVLDKLPKIGPQKVSDELTSGLGLTDRQATGLLELVLLEGTNDHVLTQVLGVCAENPTYQRGAERLAQVVRTADAAGISSRHLAIDLSIARGLDYYTGIVLETYLPQLPGIGSVCSGGRYDDLASMFTNRRLPGIGASLGLDRLLAAMEEMGQVSKMCTPAPVLVVYFDADHLSDYFRIAAAIRSRGVGAEVYAEEKKLGQQLKYADRRGFELAVIVGSQEFAERACQIKQLATGHSETVPLDPDYQPVAERVVQLVGTAGKLWNRP